jgi:hypothetical protein
LRTGDVNADGVVATGDLKEIRMNVSRGSVTGDNFRDDITVDGKVNHGDTDTREIEAVITEGEGSGETLVSWRDDRCVVRV